MSAEEMAPLWGDILRCLQRYVDRFPQDETIENVIRKCAEGKRQLWAVFDEQGRGVLTPITEIVSVDATGVKRLVFSEVGGSRIKDAMPLIEEIERWAIEEHNCTEFDFVGRKGWAPFLAPYGFKPQAIIWRKEIDDGR
jgi:hypothetical protein